MHLLYLPDRRAGLDFAAVSAYNEVKWADG
jgi:hypothetical protein